MAGEVGSRGINKSLAVVLALSRRHPTGWDRGSVSGWSLTGSSRVLRRG